MIIFTLYYSEMVFFRLAFFLFDLILGICYNTNVAENGGGSKIVAKQLRVIDLFKEEEAEDYSTLAKQLKVVNDQMSYLKKLDAGYKKKLASYFVREEQDEDGNFITVSNVPTDSKGSSFFETEDDGKPLILKREARVSISINDEKAKKFFEGKGLLSEVTSTIIVFDEDAIAQLISEEVITPEELESICDKKVNYALKFVKAEEVSEEN